MALTLDQFNAAPPADAAALLDGLYEHSPWVVERALATRPADGFPSLAALKWALVRALDAASPDEQIALIRAHPELAGRAMVAGTLTAESTGEQQRAGLTHCTPAEFERLQALNEAYRTRFGHPFILAVRGPRGTGLSRTEIIDTFARRLALPPDAERAECLRQIHRIAEIRLADKFGAPPIDGARLWDWHAALARHSEPGWAEAGQLTVTYLSDAHLACAAEIADRMRAAGFDHVRIDAVGNVVGRLDGRDREAPALLTGSHYDTVRNAGPHDGRLGILLPILAVQRLRERGERPWHAIEVVAFAEEEGQRYKATFLGSSALTGAFNPAWLDQADAAGVTMREAMRSAGLPATMDAIGALRRDPARYLGFVEVHIEQGPVLVETGLPLGIVTSINASVRYTGEVTGLASHAGTTPMNRRRDAAAAVAEIALLAEARAARDADAVATVGILEVPGGSINVVPGRCRFSLDLRAPSDAQRDALERDILDGLHAIASRRGVDVSLTETVRASAAPSDPAWQARWERAVEALGLPLHRLPSGAGHDAMKLHTVMPQAMLFVRGQNGGISHNPLESTTADDMELALRAFEQLLADLDTPASR